LLLRIEVLTPGPNRYSPRIKEVHQVHLRVTSPETATAGDVHEAAMAILAGLTPDPGYLLQRAQVLRERAQQEAERAADRAAEAEEKARALARAKQQVQEAKLHPELKMLRAQPRKGERWAKAWRNALRRLLGRDGLTTEEARGLLHIEGE
jgi:hypothetical protein